MTAAAGALALTATYKNNNKERSFSSSSSSFSIPLRSPAFAQGYPSPPPLKKREEDEGEDNEERKAKEDKRRKFYRPPFNRALTGTREGGREGGNQRRTGHGNLQYGSHTEKDEVGEGGREEGREVVACHLH